LQNIAGNFVIYTRSVPAKISGWESEAHWRLTPSDTIDGSLVFLHSEYVRLDAGLVGNVDWSGKRLDKTPGTTANLGYSHIWSLPDNANFVFHIQTKYSSAYLVSDIQNAVQYSQPAFTRTDLTVTYNLDGGNYYIQGYVKNLENKVQIQSAPGSVPNPAIPLGSSVGISEPQMMGVRFGAKY
jgi:iron complex outermembrane receptor protein